MRIIGIAAVTIAALAFGSAPRRFLQKFFPNGSLFSTATEKTPQEAVLASQDRQSPSSSRG